MEFKRCTSCGAVWNTREEFLADASVHLDGYQANFMDLEVGLFLFTHRTDSCGTTMAIYAKEFSDLYNGPIFSNSLRDTPECPKLCSRGHSLAPCPQMCECSYVRTVLQTVLNWPKGMNCKTAAQRKEKP